MTTIHPKITFNCHENWDKMKIGLTSRYCENCERDVQDFKTLTREEILQFLLTNRNTRVCGRIFKSQLDYHHEEILITIESYIKKSKNSNLSFYLLAVGTMILLGCSSHKDETQTTDSLSLALNGLVTDSVQKDVNYKSQNCKIDSLLTDEFPIVGELVVDDSLLVSDPNRERVFAEVMPEFNGGFDSLVVYIKENLKYPEWEKKAKIEGNVFVSFTVDKDGRIIDPKILKSVSGARNFDNEVVRLVKAMPKWKPGQEHGENVSVKFVLPIKFAL